MNRKRFPKDHTYERSSLEVLLGVLRVDQVGEMGEIAFPEEDPKKVFWDAYRQKVTTFGSLVEIHVMERPAH